MTGVLRVAAAMACLAACGSPVAEPGDARAPVGWAVSHSGATPFRATVDTRVAHGGVASARLEPMSAAVDGAGTLQQAIPADSYRGKRLRFSGFVHTEGVTGWTGLWMRVDRPGARSAFDNMQDRPLRGTQGWARHEVVLDIASDATAIRFGLLQDGAGRSRLDDAALEVVGPEVAVTDLDRRPRALQNGGFEARAGAGAGAGAETEDEAPAGWLLFGDGKDDVVLTVDRRERRTATASARIASRVAQPRGLSRMLQAVRADELRGRRVRATGWLKGDEIEAARLVVSVKAADSAFDSDGLSFASCALPSGSFAWRRCEVVVDVPDRGDTIEVGADLEGRGTLWVDDVELVAVGAEVPLSSVPPPDELVHGDFEDARALQGAWWVSGGARRHYGATLDRAVVHAGRASARLEPRVGAPRGYGVLIQVVSAARYRGQRVRLTAYAKVREARANLWVRVRGPSSSASSAGLAGGSRVLTGTTGWAAHEIVFDVPAAGEAIDIGAGLDERGTLWLDDVRLEPLGKATLPGSAPAAIVANGDFEDGALTGWVMSGAASAQFEASLDRGAPAAGLASARLRPRAGAPTGYGTLMQSIAAESFRGKRLRMKALVRGDGITGRGDLWLRVQAAYSPADGLGLGGGSCDLTRSFAWTPCEVVFDVPDAAEMIQLGIGLAGPGTVWLDAVILGEVPRTTPVTTVARAAPRPRNLDFEALAPPE
jgi:hypothetical protein